MKFKKLYFLLSFLVFAVLSLNFLSSAEEDCKGCLYDETCYYLGDIKVIDETPSYCNTSFTFVPQKTVNSYCYNDFECLSDYPCIEDTCVDLYDLARRNALLLSQINLTNISSTTTDNGGTNNGNDNGGSSGGGLTFQTYTINDAIFKAGYTNWMEERDRIIFYYNNKQYILTVEDIRASENIVKIEIKEPVQKGSLRKGNLYEYNLDGDNFNDIQVSVTEFSSNGRKAKITLKYIHKNTADFQRDEPESVPDNPEPSSEDGITTEVNLTPIAWIISGILFLLILIVLILIFIELSKRKKTIIKKENSKIEVNVKKETIEVKNQPVSQPAQIVKRPFISAEVIPSHAFFRPVLKEIPEVKRQKFIPKNYIDHYKKPRFKYEKKIVVSEKKQHIKVKSDKNKIAKVSKQ